MATITDHFGRLQKVELRTSWLDEARDFTPWLAKEENITLLSDAIGLKLQVEAQERSVGPFKADILCKDTSNDRDDHFVLIENQSECTNHCHLGQLLTYAAGLKAVTIIWIAERFTEEHRASLDWLNEITDTDFRFFGLEVELWKIGNSPPAPKFNVISKPNDWSARKCVRPKQLIQVRFPKQMRTQFEYWTKLWVRLNTQARKIQGTKPRRSIGRTFGRWREVWIARVDK